jgi:DNA-binding GntR family transcriptional regulator
MNLDPGTIAVPERRSLTDSVYEVVTDLLLSNSIEPNATIHIERLARALQVSPTPVREALARLEAEGLVLRRTLGGYTAAPLLDEEGLQQLFELRSLLEPHAAAKAATRISNTTIDQLNALIQAESEAAAEVPTESPLARLQPLATLDGRFHEMVADASGNELLTGVLGWLRPHTHLYRFGFDALTSDETLSEHRRIVTALSDRDATAASQAMADHIEKSFSRLERFLAQREIGHES